MAVTQPKRRKPVTIPFTTAGELVSHLGVPASRIRLHPVPGTARVSDALRETERGVPCELIDGVLVEKAVGFTESMVTIYLAHVLTTFVRRHRLGIVAGPDGPVRLAQGQMRMPDLSFVSWDSLPGRRAPAEAVLPLAPDLAIEVLSKKNTRKEMSRKRRDYFRAGGKLFWEIDPKKRLVRVFTSPKHPVTLTQADVLDGGAVLPGFTLRLRDVFAELEAHG